MVVHDPCHYVSQEIVNDYLNIFSKILHQDSFWDPKLVKDLLYDSMTPYPPAKQIATFSNGNKIM